jgi:hypothetical protein
MKKPSVKLLAAAFSLTFAGFANQASAGHSWGGYHWARESNPFTLKLGDNLSQNWQPYLAETSSDWSQSSAFDTAVVAGNTTAKRCRATAGMVQVCNSTYGNNGWLGIATVWISGTHITQGTTKLNDTYFNKSAYNSAAWRRLVMCQEIGHNFGLGHVNENFNDANTGSCMDYASNPAGPPSNEHPNDHDYVMLTQIYGHTDGSTTVAQTTASAAEMPRHIAEHDADGPTGWGKLVASSKNGLKEVYMLDFGRGYKIFRHVIWVEGRAHGKEQH